MTFAIRTPKPKPRILELENEHSFAGVVQQAAHLSGKPQRVRVVIVVRDDNASEWREVAEIWAGDWRPSWLGGIPLPPENEIRPALIEAARKEGARYAELRIKTVI